MAKRQTVPVSQRALVARINRKLRQDDEALRLTRRGAASRWYSTLGDAYIVDLRHNAITAEHVDIEALGRKLSVLGEWEHLAD